MFKATKEMKFEVSNGRIKDVRLSKDGSCTLIVEIEFHEGENIIFGGYQVPVVEKKYEDFILVEASKIKPNERLLKKYPFKDVLLEPVKNGELKDFCIPGMDPSFSKEGSFHYVKGELPAVGQSYNWWEYAAKQFDPEHNSRLGTRVEYYAFLYILIDEMIKRGWKYKKAIKAVCNNSKEIAHIWDSPEAKRHLEDTGEREVCGYFDLGNTKKILAKDEKYAFLWIMGVNYRTGSYNHSLTTEYNKFNYEELISDAVGWIVCDNI